MRHEVPLACETTRGKIVSWNVAIASLQTFREEFSAYKKITLDPDRCLTWSSRYLQSKMVPTTILITTCLALFSASANAQSSSSCSTTLTASYPAPSVALGYTVRLIANNLTRPRSIHFDKAGHLLVVEAGRAISALTLTDGGGSCLSVANKQTVVADTGVSSAGTSFKINLLTVILVEPRN
jgi:hypothetical protein